MYLHKKIFFAIILSLIPIAFSAIPKGIFGVKSDIKTSFVSRNDEKDEDKLLTSIRFDLFLDAKNVKMTEDFINSFEIPVIVKIVSNNCKYNQVSGIMTEVTRNTKNNTTEYSFVFTNNSKPILNFEILANNESEFTLYINYGDIVNKKYNTSKKIL